MKKQLIFKDGRRLFLIRMVSLQKATEIVASGTTTTAGAQIIFWQCQIGTQTIVNGTWSLASKGSQHLLPKSNFLGGEVDISGARAAL